VWYGEMLVQRMPRLRGQHKHLIDYRHVIGWLVRKPRAFARYVYRSTVFRRAYDTLVSQGPERADRCYVQLLHLASEEGEALVAAALERLLGTHQALSVHAVRSLLGQAKPAEVVAGITVAPVDLAQYDALLSMASVEAEAVNEAVSEAVSVASAIVGLSHADCPLERQEEVKHDAESGRGSEALSRRAALGLYMRAHQRNRRRGPL
jgi:hypothetical protein